MDPLDVARDLLAQRFPAARTAILAGSALTPRRTATSDLDVVVVLPTEPPYRETVRHQGWLVEVFVHTRESLDRFWTAETASRRSPLLRMCAEGVAVSGPEVAAEIQAEAARRWAAGPPPLTAAETQRRRYALTDLLDDLAGTPEPAERPFVLAAILQQTAELGLLISGHWLGTGKWLARELADCDPALLPRLTRTHAEAVAGQPVALIATVDEVLARTGGRLADGYRQGEALTGSGSIHRN